MIARARLSVALCTYDGERFLPEQLESLVAQSRRPDELVVCDDRSRDATVAVVEAFARRAPFPVRLHVNARNLGSTGNFEQAIRRCTGDVIFLADQDDVWSARKVERLAAVLEDEPAVAAVFSDAELVDEALRPIGTRLWDAVGFTPRERAAVREGRPLEVLLRHEVVTGATLAFRRAAVPGALPIPRAWFHDGWIALLAAAEGRLALVEEPLIAYRQHARNLVGARRRGFGAQLEVARRLPRAEYRRVAARFLAARRRLAGLPETPDRARLRRTLREKALHQLRRARMPASPARRVCWVLRELAGGRYDRYAAGPRSAAKDLLRL